MTPDQGERQHAIRRFEAGDYPDAARRLVSLLARVPPDPMLLRLCGMALVRSGAAAQGLPYLARARRLAPRDVLAALWHGIALHAAARFDEAAAALQAAAALAPDDPAPRVHLARALLKLDRPADALAAARVALARAPETLEAQHALRLAELAMLTAGPAAPDAASNPRPLAAAWLELGLVCARLGHVADARAAMRQSLATEPGFAAAAAHLAVVEHLSGEPATATLRLREVLARDPECGIARLHLAGRLTLDGEAETALALLAGPPPAGVAEAHWAARRTDALLRLGRTAEARAELAQLHGPAGDAEILLCGQRFRLAWRQGDQRAAASLADLLARHAGDRGAELEPRIHAHFTVADWRHARGERAAAFAHWQRGHALLRAAQPFSRAAHQAMVSAIIDAYDRRRLEEGPRADDRDQTPVFIVGLPRTGTTLTEQILAAHPAVHGAGERLAVRETLRRLAGTADAEQAVHRAAGLDLAALNAAASDYLSVLHALSPGAGRILDKMPDNFFHLGFIATLLPGARILCCTRDLRDVGASIFQHGFVGYHPYAHDLADLGWALAQHQRLLRHWRTLPGLQMLEVDHAHWVEDFDATLRRVLDFLGLPYDDACTRFDRQRRTVRTASREQVRQPINARGVGRWQGYAGELAPMLRELAGS